MKPVFFTDRDLGKRFPDTLRGAGLNVERHHDLFPPDGSDEQWLEYCGRNRRIALSHNERIRYTPNELDAVIVHHVSLIIVVGKAPLPQLPINFVNSLHRIETFLTAHEPPFIAKLYRPSPSELQHGHASPGSITLWYPKSRQR